MSKSGRDDGGYGGRSTRWKGKSLWPRSGHLLSNHELIWLRVTAIKLNRSRAVDIDNVTLPLPAPLPEMDQQQVFDNLQHQLALARLTKILDRVADIG